MDLKHDQVENEQVESAKEIPLHAMWLVTSDVIMTCVIWVTAGYKIGVWDFLNYSVVHYDWYRSLFDVFIISLIRPFVVGYLIWKMRFGHLPFFHRVGLIVIPTITATFVAIKWGFVGYGRDIRDLYGVMELNFATLIFCLAMPILELLVSVYAIIIDNRIIDSGYSRLAEEKTSFEANVKITKRIVSEGEKHSSAGRIAQLAVPETPLLLGGTVGLLIGTGSTLAMPYFFGQIIAALLDPNPDEANSNLIRGVLLLLATFIIGAFFTSVRGYLFTLAGQRLVARLRSMAFATILSQDIHFFDATRIGDLTNRLASDTQVVQNAATVNISMALRNAVQAIGAVALLFLSSWKLTLVMLSVVPVVAISVVFFARHMKNLSEEFQKLLATSTATAEEALSGIRTVRSFGCDDKVKDKYRTEVDASYQVGSRYSLTVGVFSGVIRGFSLGAILLVVWYGGTLVLDGQLSAGDLLAFLLYTLTLATSVALLGSTFGDFMSAVGASERIFEIIDTVPEIPLVQGNIGNSVQGEIEFVDVRFSYPSRTDKVVLDGFSLRIAPGEIVALVGPSGGGKTTVVSLIQRFYDIQAGSILIDKREIDTLSPQWLRRQMCVVSQEPALFAASIKENIAFGAGKDVTDEDIIEAAKGANAHTFISQFPDGYDTLVGERGVQLSGGQKQRVAIARALLLNPKILLLDEATSALDAESEHLVQEAIGKRGPKLLQLILLDKAMKGRTVLIIAHRLSTVKDADKIVVIKRGKIAEQGTHNELIQRSGLYKQLVKRQLQSSTNDKKLKKSASSSSSHNSEEEGDIED